MTPLKKKLLLALSTILLMQGCTAVKYKEFEKAAQEKRDYIHSAEEAYKYRQVRDVETPPINVEAIVKESPISWLDDEQVITADKTPLSIVVDQITKGVVTPEYDFDIDPNLRVSLNHTGTKETALKMLGLQADVFFQMTEDKVFVRRYVSETFTLPAISGEMSYQIGSDGGTTTGNTQAMEGSISTTGGDDGQFSKAGYQDYNLTTQITDGIKAIIADPVANDDSTLIGSVSEIKGMSSIVVRTTPSLMENVRTFVNKAFDQMSEEVVLKVEVIEWQLEEGSEFGLEASLSKLTGDSYLNLISTAPSLSESNGTGIGFTGGGDWEGSTALLKMMSKYGEVSVTTEQTIKALNQKSQEVDLSDIRSYVSRTSTIYDEDSVGPKVEIETSSVRDGVKMLVIPSIHENHVYLRINGTLSKFVYFDKQKISGAEVSQPRTRQSRFNVEGKYEYNKPIIVTQMKQIVEQSQKQTTAEVIPGNMGERRVVNTLVLLTPTRKMEKG